MKRVLSDLLARDGGSAGRVPFERAGSSCIAANRAGASGAEPAAAGVRHRARYRHAPCARDCGDIRPGYWPRAKQVLVREGDTVRAGQTLAVLDDATLRAAADQAEAAVKAAENQQAAAQTNADLAASTLARYKQLQAQKSVSPQEMDEVARAGGRFCSAGGRACARRPTRPKLRKAALAPCLAMHGLTAPFAGVVTARMADPGRWLRPVCRFSKSISAGPLQLQATVDESAIGSVRKGMKIDVSIDGAPSLDPAGTVSEIVPAADPHEPQFSCQDRSARPRPGCGPACTQRPRLLQAAAQAIFAPRSAVVMRGSLPCAYVLDGNGIAQLRYVTLGAQQGNMVEVLSGISAGERLVDDPGDRDLAGKRIEVQP